MHENEKYPGVPERIQLMDENGKVHENPTFSSYVQDVDAEQLREAYRLMYITRRIDDEGTALQRQGQMALWAPSRGQEAAQVGSALAFAPNDYIFPSYREHAVAFARGVDFRELITVFRGSHTHGWDPKKHNFHVYTKVLAAQIPHAVGYAMGLNFDADIAAETGQLQTGQGQATNPDNDTVKPAVGVYFGDGSSTEGEVHEAMVFAASWRLLRRRFLHRRRSPRGHGLCRILRCSRTLLRAKQPLGYFGTLRRAVARAHLNPRPRLRL